jgi:hypothetical protein
VSNLVAAATVSSSEIRIEVIVALGHTVSNNPLSCLFVMI